MKILIFTNIPSPYRIDFFNELGKNTELTVIFEAKTAKGIKFNWNIEEIKNFEAIFLKEGDIQENKINWKILKYIKKNRYDEIIITSYAYYTEMIALLALKFKRIPYFMEVDGGLIREENILKKIYKSFLISNAKGYFSPSKFTDVYLLYYGANKEKIYRYPFTSLKEKDILENIVDREKKHEIRKKLKINETKVIVSVGQFIHRKGFDVLLNACSKLEENVGVYVIGGQPTEEYLELVKKFGLTNVHFEGFKTKAELSEYFKAADLFVLPTREDVWGLVINEAMANGLPVVTTNKCVAGIELIEEEVNGYIVPVGDSEALAAKINRIINDIKIQSNMSQNNLYKIKNYRIEDMARRHIEIFDMLNRGD